LAVAVQVVAEAPLQRLQKPDERLVRAVQVVLQIGDVLLERLRVIPRGLALPLLDEVPDQSHHRFSTKEHLYCSFVRRLNGRSILSAWHVSDCFLLSVRERL